MGDNLPSGVTPGDIDKHFGAPDRDDYMVAGEVSFSVTVSATDEADAEEKAKEIIRDAKTENGASFHDPRIAFAER